MVEGSFRSVDPLAYYVNNVSELDVEVVKAYKNKDQERIKELVSRGKMDLDLFICVNKHWHGFVLCVPAGDEENGIADFESDVVKSPFDVPALLMCWQFELCIENDKLRMYKIRKECQLFRDTKQRIHRSFYIGRFKRTSLNALHLAAMRAAPHRYNVLLEDCVEFAKEFCIQTLAYCSNWRDLESQVNENIARATASGFSVEKLSRNVRSSGWLGNTFLGGMDISGLMSGRYPLAVMIVIGVCFLVYPILVAIVVYKLLR